MNSINLNIPDNSGIKHQITINSKTITLSKITDIETCDRLFHEPISNVNYNVRLGVVYLRTPSKLFLFSNKNYTSVIYNDGFLVEAILGFDLNTLIGVMLLLNIPVLEKGVPCLKFEMERKLEVVLDGELSLI
jgi:hypothetical protein